MAEPYIEMPVASINCEAGNSDSNETSKALT